MANITDIPNRFLDFMVTKSICDHLYAHKDELGINNVVSESVLELREAPLISVLKEQTRNMTASLERDFRTFYYRIIYYPHRVKNARKHLEMERVESILFELLQCVPFVKGNELEPDILLPEPLSDTMNSIFANECLQITPVYRFSTRKIPRVAAERIMSLYIEEHVRSVYEGYEIN